MATIEVPGIGDVHFPEGMPQVEMETAIKNLLIQKQSGQFDPNKRSTGTVSTKPDAPVTAPITAQPPRFPKLEQAAKDYAVPAATFAAGLIPGSIPLQAAIGAGGEALNQLSAGKGLGDLDYENIAIAGATPLAARAVMGAGKSVARAVVNQSARQQMAESAVGKVESKFGVGKKAVKALDAAKANPTPVTEYANTFKTLDDIIAKDTRLIGGSKPAVAFAEEALDKLTTPGAKPYSYGEIVESTSAIREAAEAAGDNRTMKRIYEVREALLKDIDKLGPEARDAFKLYRRDQSVKEISDVFRSGGFTLSKFERLLAKDPLVAGAFNDKEKAVLKTIATHIGPESLTKILAATGIVGGAGYAAAGAPGLTVSSAIPLIIGGLMSHPQGQFMARVLIGPGGVPSKAALPAFAQWMRGYMAEQEAK